jgi:hypothetical protein
MGESASDCFPNEGGKGGGYVGGSTSRIRILVSADIKLGEAEREGGANDFGAPVDTPLTAIRGPDGCGDCNVLAIDE